MSTERTHGDGPASRSPRRPSSTWRCSSGRVRPDGFHEIASLMLPVTLADRGGRRAHAGRRAGRRLRRRPRRPTTSPPRLVRELEARLEPPLRGARDHRASACRAGGGLGGGSSDAAATLLALERLFSLDLSAKVRYDVAAAVGSRRAVLPLARPAARHGPRPGAQGRRAAGAPPRGRHARPRAEHRRRVPLARRGRRGDAQGVRAAGAAAVEPASRRRATVKDVAALVANDLEASVVARKPKVGALHRRACARPGRSPPP